MSLILILIALFVLFIGFCALIGLGILLGGDRGKSFGVLSSVASGIGLLVFLFVMAVFFISAPSSREIGQREVQVAVSSLRENSDGHDVKELHVSYGPTAGEDSAKEEASEDSNDLATKQETGLVLADRDHDQPDWVDQPPQRIGKVYRSIVVSDPKLTKEECDASLSGPIMEIAQDYVDQLLGSGASKIIGLEEAEIRKEVCKAEYIQKRMSKTVGVGEMNILHVLMEFDEPFRNKIRLLYRQAVVQQRMIMTGGGAFSILIILGSIFGYLQIDTVTKGFYTRRLQLATAAVILTVLLLGMAMLA